MLAEIAEIEFAGCRPEHMEIAQAVNARVADVLATGRVLQGPEVQTFESELASACGRSNAICVGSGTDALFFALTALGIGPGDEVLVPDISFVATASSVVRTGARPVFVDVDESCNLDLEHASARITPRTRAILYVQLFGGMGDPDSLEAFGLKHGLFVVEDGAQSFGARFAGRPCGSVGSASVLSFDPMKVLSAPGSGGAVLTDDPQVANRVRRLRYHGRENGAYVELGFNSQLPSITAAVLSLKLGHHERWTQRRTAIANGLLGALADLPLSFPRWSDSVDHVWHKFALRCEARDDLAAWLKTKRIPTMVHYARPFHRESIFGLDDGARFVRASAHAATTLSLPIHAHLTVQQTDHITQSVIDFFRRRL